MIQIDTKTGKVDLDIYRKLREGLMTAYRYCRLNKRYGKPGTSSKYLFETYAWPLMHLTDFTYWDPRIWIKENGEYKYYIHAEICLKLTDAFNYLLNPDLQERDAEYFQTLQDKFDHIVNTFENIYYDIHDKVEGKTKKDLETEYQMEI